MSRNRVSRLEPESPMHPAAQSIIRSRMRSVTRLVKDISRGCIRKAEYIHQLRVAIRRAEAAISAFEPELRPRAVARARRRLRAVRKAAGAVRDCDVHDTLLRQVDGLDRDEQAPVRTYLKRRLKAARRAAAAEMLSISGRGRVRRLKKSRRQLSALPRPTSDGDSSLSTLMDAAHRTLLRVAAETRAVAGSDTSNLDNLHALRVSAKQVRYAVEVFRTCIPDALCESTLTHLREFQAALGRVNDARQMSTWLADEARFLAGAARPRSIPRGCAPESIHEELRVIVGRLEADLAAAHQAALPSIEARLDSALRPLEDWARASSTFKADVHVEEDSDSHRTLAGRRAEGSRDRAEHARDARTAAAR